MTRALLCILFAFLTSASRADISFESGVLRIDSSGEFSGSSAGDINLNLSYADETKSQVKIEGEIIYRRSSSNISEVVELKELKSIVVRAIGRNGAPGRSGAPGRRGRDGRHGWNGCPPGDGEHGYDGGRGGDGQPGEDGGDGGHIKIETPEDQSEILLLVTAQTKSGHGGIGGSGGRGGFGGRGGIGGRNTCRDSKGRPTGGPNGRHGRDGWSGPRGSDGWSGRDGSRGSLKFNLVGEGGTETYPAPFKLIVSGIKSIDDNQDTVLEPGENLHITQLILKNTGKMPSPAGQMLRFAFRSNDLLKLVKANKASINKTIQPGQSAVLNLKKGQVVFNVIKKDGIIGKKPEFNGALAINKIRRGFTKESGKSIRWRVGLDAVAENEVIYFDKPKTVSFSIKNVSSKDVGPSTDPIEVRISWSSEDLPGNNIEMTLPNGNKVTLDKTITVSDFSVASGSTLKVPLGLSVSNEPDLLATLGNLKISLKMEHAFQGIEIADIANMQFEVFRDLRGIAIKHQTDLTQVECAFYKKSGYAQIGRVYFEKALGADKINIRWGYKKWPRHISPAYAIPVDNFVRYSRSVLVNKPTKEEGKLFMNRTVGPASRKTKDKDWSLGHCSVMDK